MASWQDALISSRLLQYEVWCRLNAPRMTGTRGGAAGELLGRMAMIELSHALWSRSGKPVRTLGALHLAALEFLRQRRLEPVLASYDQRMVGTARSMGIAISELD